MLEKILSIISRLSRACPKRRTRLVGRNIFPILILYIRRSVLWPMPCDMGGLRLMRPIRPPPQRYARREEFPFHSSHADSRNRPIFRDGSREYPMRHAYVEYALKTCMRSPDVPSQFSVPHR